MLAISSNRINVSLLDVNSDGDAALSETAQAAQDTSPNSTGEELQAVEKTASMPPSTDVHLPLEDALQIISAEFWLKLGEAGQALVELEKLPSHTWNHPWAARARDAAIGRSS